MHRPSAFILRLMLAGQAIAYGLALYLQWHRPNLSIEAQQYQQDVLTIMSGLSPNYALRKLCWLLGMVGGAFGIVLMFVRIRSGLLLLVGCPPLLLAATVLGAPPTAYPNIEHLSVIVLWCVSSAIWGCVVSYALMGYKTLFWKETPDASTA